MFDDFLQYPRILGCNLFVVIFVNTSFVEPMVLIEPLGICVGDLNVEGYALDFGLDLGRCCSDDALQGLRAQLSGSVRLRKATVSASDLSRPKWRLTARMPKVVKYNSLFSSLQQIFPTGISLK